MGNTKDITNGYFAAFNNNGNWQDLISEDITFKGPMQIIEGKEQFVEMTKQFRQVVAKSQVKNTLVDGEWASALTNYNLAAPNGKKLDLDVSEIVGTKDGKINYFEIYFDTAKFNQFMADTK